MRLFQMYWPLQPKLLWRTVDWSVCIRGQYFLCPIRLISVILLDLISSWLPLVGSGTFCIFECHAVYFHFWHSMPFVSERHIWVSERNVCLLRRYTVEPVSLCAFSLFCFPLYWLMGSEVLFQTLNYLLSKNVACLPRQGKMKNLYMRGDFLERMRAAFRFYSFKYNYLYHYLRESCCLTNTLYFCLINISSECPLLAAHLFRIITISAIRTNKGKIIADRVILSSIRLRALRLIVFFFFIDIFFIFSTCIS